MVGSKEGARSFYFDLQLFENQWLKSVLFLSVEIKKAPMSGAWT